MLPRAAQGRAAELVSGAGKQCAAGTEVYATSLLKDISLWIGYHAAWGVGVHCRGSVPVSNIGWIAAAATCKSSFSLATEAFGVSIS
jgi:hypothetical protein